MLVHFTGEKIPFHTQHDEILGSKRAEVLLQACLNWVRGHYIIDKNSLQGILADPDFNNILVVDAEMKERGYPDLVPSYIFELATFNRQVCLMVPYAYLTKTVPRRFLRSQIPWLGYGSGLPTLMKQMGLFTALSNELSITRETEVAAKSQSQSGVLDESTSQRSELLLEGHCDSAKKICFKSSVDQAATECDGMIPVKLSAIRDELLQTARASSSCSVGKRYICSYCNRSSETLALPAKVGPFHAVDCPRHCALPREDDTTCTTQ